MLVPKILLVTVSYNNFKSTEEYIKSFLSLDDNANSLLVVVDNSINKDLVLSDFVKKINRDNIIYLRQDENLGYMSGCNYGYSYIKKIYNVDSSIVIYSNNDILFSNNLFLKNVISNFNKIKGLGVLVPCVFDSNTKKNLNPFMLSRPSIRFLIKLRLLYSNYYLCLFLNYISKLLNSKRSNLDLNGFDSVYACHGSIFIMSPQLIRNETPDDKYFLYAEEITIAEMCLNLGLKVKYVHEIKIIHVSHSTTGTKFNKREFLFKKNAIKYILNKYTWS